MTDAYMLWKTVHVVPATIVLGTGMGIAFFCWFGTRDALARGDLGALRMVLHFTVRADAIFTAPAVAVQLITGVMLMTLAGWKFASPWALASLGLFAFAGACWLPVVWIQLQLARMADAASRSDQLSARFGILFRWWLILGALAFPAVLCIVYLMVAKPLRVV